MSGQWWESDLIVGPFANITEANAWAAANPSSLFLGLLATSNGQQIKWGGAGVGWNPSSCGPIYNGTTLPFPAGGDCLRIRVANPAVPKGWSWLEWNGTIWAPPAGELIVAVQPSSEASPVALVTLGVTTLAMIAQSAVIPDYMLPNLLEWEITGMMGVQSATTGPCILGIGISGQLPTAPWVGNYPLSASTVPQASPNFAGFDPNFIRKMQTRRGINFRHSPIQTRAYYDYPSSTGTFVSGANRLYAMAVPDSASTIVRLDAMAAYSRGNL